MSYEFSRYICNQVEKESEIEVIRYGIEVTMKAIIKIASLITVGIILDNIDTLGVTCLSFILLRLASGGFHFNSYMNCYFFSIISLAILSKMAEIISSFDWNWSIVLIIINILACTILIIFKPLINANRPYSKRGTLYLIVSLVILIFSIGFSLTIKKLCLEYSIAIQLSILFQSMMLIRIKTKGNVRNEIFRRNI